MPVTTRRMPRFARWTTLPARTMGRMLLLMAAAAVPARAQPMEVVLPTSNDALLRGDGPGFYMYTDRNFDGIASQPWEGGRYGFHRNTIRTPAGLVGTRFHEGMDIRPRFRDLDGEPLDSVVSVDDGRVVYVNTSASASAYGRYVVVEYEWQGSPYYGLFAHLSDVYAVPGTFVRRGQRLARMGYTGVGIDRRRSHLHFELNLYLSDRFDAWFARYTPRSSNVHGRWNGVNLAGFDVADFYRTYHDRPTLWLPGFLRRQPWAFEVEVPGGHALELVGRYPWLLEGSPDELPGGYEITFTESGFPTRITPVERLVFDIGLVRVADRVRNGYLATNGHLTRRGDSYTLSTRGKRYVELVATPAPALSRPADRPFGW